MADEVIKCPRCGSADSIKHTDNGYVCSTCGATFKDDSLKKALDAINDRFDEEDQKRIANLKKMLWSKIHEKYLDSDEIHNLCHGIKGFIAEDPFANFFYVASADFSSGANETALCKYLDDLDVEENADDMDVFIPFLLKSVTPRNTKSIGRLIERAYKNSDPEQYQKYIDVLESEAQKIEEGVYDPGDHRTFYILHSSKDLAQVEKLVTFLEEAGETCFYSERNLQRGNGCCENYSKNIETAINSCDAVILVSSTNSRNKAGDVKKEMELLDASDRKREKPIIRIEYIVDEYKNTGFDAIVKKYFPSNKCYDFGQIIEKFTQSKEQDDSDVGVYEMPIQFSDEKAVKYCKLCGSEVPLNKNFCPDCGSGSFVETREEYIRLRRESAKELENIKEKERLLEEAERRNKSAIYVESRETPRPQEEPDRHNIDYTQHEEEYVERRDPRNKAGQPSNKTPHRSLFDDATNAKPKGSRDEEPNHHRIGAFYPVEIGQRISFPDEVTKISVVSKYDIRVSNISVSCCAFCLSANEKVLSESDFVFFNNPSSLNCSVRLETDEKNNTETLDVYLNRINYDIETIRLIYSVISDNPRNNFNAVKSLSISIDIDGDTYNYVLKDIGKVQNVTALEFYRYKNKWKIRSCCHKMDSSLEEICKQYNLKVS